MSKTNCPECGKAMTCGADMETGCWCNEFPPVVAPEPGATCLCPSCLAVHLRQRIQDRFASLDRAECLQLARPYRDQKPLIEDLDYYMEHGLFVLTEWFHWKRGRCCGNACRHCPYEHEAVGRGEVEP